MVSFGFFNSSNGDRRYSSEDISRIFSFLITDGVLMTYGDKFFTTPSTSTLGVMLGTGWAWFNSTWTQSDAKIPFALSEPDPSLDRYDTICLKVDKRSLGRVNSFVLLEGAPAVTPKVVTPPTETDVYYHPLAHVKVRHGVTRISASDIDILVGKTNTPFITSILQTTDITTLFQGWSEQFGTKMTQWEGRVSALETSGNQQLQSQQTAFDQAQTSRQNAFDTAQTNRQTAFNTAQSTRETTFNTSLTGWETEFRTWFDNLQTYLSQDVVTAIWADLDELKKNTDRIMNNLNRSFWEPMDVDIVPFKGAKKDGVLIPTMGDRHYPVMTEYNAAVPNLGDKPWIPTPASIMSMVKQISPISMLVAMIDTRSIKIPRDGWYAFMLVGGGGSGGYYARNANDTLYCGGGGGGSGSVVPVIMYLKVDTILDVTVGAGGYSSTTPNRPIAGYGGDTKITIPSIGFTITARGGQCGQSSVTSAKVESQGGGNRGSVNGTSGSKNFESPSGGGSGGIYGALSSGSVILDARAAPISGDTYRWGLGAGGGGGIIHYMTNTSYSIFNGGVSSAFGGDGGDGGYSVQSGNSISRRRDPNNGGRAFFHKKVGVVTNAASTYSGGGGGGGGLYSEGGDGGTGCVSHANHGAGGGGGGGGIGGRGGRGGNSGLSPENGYSGEGYGAGGGGIKYNYTAGGGGAGGFTLFTKELGLTPPASKSQQTGHPGIVLGWYIPLYNA